MTTKMDINYVVLLLVICGPELIVADTTTTTQPSTATTTLALTTTQPALNDTETSTAENATAPTSPTNTTDAMAYDEADNTTTTTTAVPVTLAFTTTTSADATTTTIATTTRAPFNCTVPGAVCKNNGTCHYSGQCYCGEAFTGEQCELVRLCYNDTSCENNGTCDFHENYGYNCTCVTGDQNANCALNKVEECTKLPVSAIDIHSCIDYIDGYKLLCNENFTGNHCEKRATDDYCTREGADYCTDIDYCKPLCNLERCNGTSACNFTIKPFDDPIFTSKPDCQRDFGNGFAVYPIGKCHTEEALFDAFDDIRRHLTDCSPYFNTICAFSFANGTCDERCNNKDCLWDGWDCAKTVHVQPIPISGRLVLELKPFDVTGVNKTAQVKKVLGLLLRSKLDVALTTTPVPHVHVRVSSTNFTKISAVGKFVAAAISTMPYLGLEVTDVFVCENGTYSASYSDKCSLKCSPNCRPVPGQDYCDVMTGNCMHGCMGGFFGPMCNQSCPKSCADNCNSDGICNCQSGSYWSEAGKRCIPCSTNCGNVCDPRHGSCTCKPKFYGKLCEKVCSFDCLSGTCRMDGTCSGGCVKGRHGPLCGLTCPDRCPECTQDTGNCQGKCIAGYAGKDCKKVVMPPPPVTDNTGVIIAVILAIVIVVTIVVVAYCCWKRRQSGDYVLGDEEGEPTPKMTGMGGGGAETQGAIMMQPHKPDLGKSTDMIDMDEGNAGIGIYQGPNRQTVVATNITDITANDHPTKEVNANGDVVVNGNVDTEQETSQRASLTVDVGMTVDADMVDSGEPTSADVIPAEVTIQVDVDEDDETPGSPENDMALVPLNSSLAPLASEENILLSKENLLADADATAADDKPDVGTDAEPEEDKASSRKSSTSSKSSKSSSSSKSNRSSRSSRSSHSSKTSDSKRDSKAEEPTTEM